MKSLRPGIYLLFLLLTIFGCGKEEQPAYIGKPAIEIRNCTTKDNIVTLTIASINCDAVYGLAVKASSGGTTSAERIVSEGIKAVKDTLRFTGLDAGTEHKAYIVGVKGDMCSAVMSTSFYTPTENGTINDKSLIFADLDLLAGGSSYKKPHNWDEERLKPHVVFRDRLGKEEWLHEAFLFIGGMDYSRGTVLCITSDGKSANKDSWEDFIDYWFRDGTGVLDMLDLTIANAKSRIGEPPFRHAVVITMPDPIRFEYFGKKTNTKYWGAIDGRQMDFSKVEDQVMAYKWYIGKVLERWKQSAPNHLRLAGFYILSEELVAKPSGWNYKYKEWDKILPPVSEYIHSLGDYGLYWIPYYMADGHDMTRQLGIDMTYMQPNKYWDYNNEKPWSTIFDAMDTYGLGMELEFEGTHGEDLKPCTSILEKLSNGADNPRAAVNKSLFRDYMNSFKKAGYYGKKPIAIYSGTNAMYELAASNEPEDVDMYEEYCRFIIDSPLRKQ